MKKLFVGVLAIASMVACMNEETVRVQDPAAIGFEANWVENATRANEAVDPSTTTESLTGFFNYFLFPLSVKCGKSLRFFVGGNLLRHCHSPFKEPCKLSIYFIYFCSYFCYISHITHSPVSPEDKEPFLPQLLRRLLAQCRHRVCPLR